MKFLGVQLWGPDMDTSVEIWLIEEIPMPLSDPTYHKVCLFNTTWEKVYKWAEIPQGEYSQSNPIVVVKAEFKGRIGYLYLTKQVFEEKFKSIPTVSAGGRIRNLEDALELFGHAKDIFSA